MPVKAKTVKKPKTGAKGTKPALAFRCADLHGGAIAMPSDDRVAAGANDITVWNVSDGAEIAHLVNKGKGMSFVESVAFSEDGTRAIAGTKKIKLFDATSGAELLELDGHRGSLRGVQFIHGDTRIASISGDPFTGGDNSVSLWDARSGQRLWSAKLAQEKGQVAEGVALAAVDDTVLYVLVARPSMVLTYDLKEGALGRCQPMSPESQVGNLAITSAGVLVGLVQGGNQSGITVLVPSTLALGPVLTQQYIVERSAHFAKAFGTCPPPIFAAAGELVAVAGVDGVTLAHASDMSVQATLKVPVGLPLPRRLAFSPSGKSIAALVEDGSVVVWDCASGKVRAAP